MKPNTRFKISADLRTHYYAIPNTRSREARYQSCKMTESRGKVSNHDLTSLIELGLMPDKAALF